MAYFSKSGSRSLMKLSENVGWNYNPVKVWLSLEEPLPIWLTQMASNLLLIVVRRLQFLPMFLASSQCCLSVLITWLLALLTVSDLREYILITASEVTYRYIFNILLSALIIVEGCKYKKDYNVGIILVATINASNLNVNSVHWKAEKYLYPLSSSLSC